MQWYGISWNVAGIAKASMELFFHDISAERRWTVLLLQEASFRRRDSDQVQYSLDGHLVLSMAPHAGQRAGAIIFHRDVTGKYVENSFRQCGRSCCAEVLLDGILVLCVCAHLYAKQSLSTYNDSLNDVETLINVQRKKNTELMIGVDLQDKICFL